MTVSEAARQAGIPRSTIQKRMEASLMTLDEAIAMGKAKTVPPLFMEGATYGCLTIIKLPDSPLKQNKPVLVECECGNQYYRRYANLKQTLRTECKCVMR